MVKIYYVLDVHEGMDHPNEERLRLGINVIELIWSEMARKIVEQAIVIYDLGVDQAAALRKAFLSRTLLRFVPS
jgi:hypothetical protein